MRDRYIRNKNFNHGRFNRKNKETGYVLNSRQFIGLFREKNSQTRNETLET